MMRGKEIFIMFLLALLCIYCSQKFGLAFLFFAAAFFMILISFAKICFKRKIFFACVCMIWMLVIGLYTLNVLNVERFEIYKYTGDECRIYGKISEVCEENEQYRRYVLKIDKAANKYGKNLTDVNVKVNFIVRGKKANQLNYGDYICTLAELENLSDKRNSSEFDFKLYNYSNKIFFDAYADDKNIKIYNCFNKAEDIYDAAHIIREYIKDVAFKNMRQENASLLMGILLSDKSYFGDETYKEIQNAGIMHMFVASGLHVACIISVMSMIMLLFRVKKKYAVIPAAPVLIMFIFINGCSPSIMRAVLLFAFYATSRFLGRDDDLLLSGGAAGIIILLLNPMSAFDIGFLFSFLSMYGIIFFAKSFYRVFDKILPVKPKKRTPIRTFAENIAIYAKSTAAVCISSSIIIIPLCSYLFGYISIYGILSNLLIVWILPYAMFSASLMLIFAPVGIFGKAAAWITDVIFDYITAVIKATANLPFSSVEIYMPAAVVFVCIIFAFGLYFFMHGKLKMSCAFALVCVILIVTGTADYARNFDTVRVCFVNVGQGDGCFVKMNGNEAVVIDGGGSLVSQKDNVFVPYMKKSGIKKISYVFVSHFDTDHAKNILHVLDNFKVSNVVMPIRENKSEYKSLIEEKARKYGINIINVCDGDFFEIDNNVSVRVYAPPKHFKYFRSENEGSMAMMLDVYGSRFLFLGDLDANVQDKMAYKYKDELKCDVLKVSHHGSFKSYSRGLVRFAKPEYAVISSGSEKIYNHPDKETVYELSKNKSDVLCTNRNGDITFYVDENNLEYRSFLQGKGSK